jgi:hypothetical protein
MTFADFDLASSFLHLAAFIGVGDYFPLRALEATYDIYIWVYGTRTT